MTTNPDSVIDPLTLASQVWPKVQFYKEQIEAIYSVRDDDETYIPAGNMLGKDFVSAFICLWFFLSRHPCRIVTTSAKEDHLRVLWGEIGNFINTAKYSLEAKENGNLIINHQEIRKLYRGKKCALSYVRGMVANDESIAAMGGHHIAQTGDGIPRTLFVVDEASSVPDKYYKTASPWANRVLVIGNTWPCSNFFKHAIKGTPDGKIPGGNISREDGNGYHRRVIHITALDSPNVRYALNEIESGKEPSGKIIIDGVKPYTEYLKNLKMMDDAQQSVSLRAEFYEGFENMLFPEEWLEVSAKRAEELGTRPRIAKAIGVDTAEGGDNTCWTVIDELGVIDQISEKTSDTSEIFGKTIGLMRQYKVEPSHVLFDRGGGGKQHTDYLKKKGYNVKSVGFGEAPKLPLKRGIHQLKHRKVQEEEKYVYKNKRAELFGVTSERINPDNGDVFAIPMRYTELRRQLAPIPRMYDGEGRLMLPPKNKPQTLTENESKTICLKDILGCSPDEADSLVLAVYVLHEKNLKIRIGALV